MLSGQLLSSFLSLQTAIPQDGFWGHMTKGGAVLRSSCRSQQERGPLTLIWHSTVVQTSTSITNTPKCLSRHGSFSCSLQDSQSSSQSGFSVWSSCTFITGSAWRIGTEGRQYMIRHWMRRRYTYWALRLSSMYALVHGFTQTNRPFSTTYTRIRTMRFSHQPIIR